MNNPSLIGVIREKTRVTLCVRYSFVDVSLYCRSPISRLPGFALSDTCQGVYIKNDSIKLVIAILMN